MLSVSSPEITQGAAPAPSAVLSRSAPYGIALLRVALGVLLFAHGALKVFVFTLPGTAAFFASAGFPAWSAYLVAPAEVLGGLALMLGFQTRLVALLSLPILLGALSVHLGNGWLFSAPKGGGNSRLFWWAQCLRRRCSAAVRCRSMPVVSKLNEFDRGPHGGSFTCGGCVPASERSLA